VGAAQHDVYIVAPAEATSYGKVFRGSQMSKAYIDEIAQMRRSAEDAHLAAHFSDDSDGSAEFFSFLRGSKSKVVSVIGHNELGVFRFASGETAHLVDLAKLCTQAVKRCVFFSCDAQTVFREFRVEFHLGANTPLSYREAIKAAIKLDSYVRDGRGAMSVGDLHKVLPDIVASAVDGAKLNARVSLVVEIGAGVAVASAVVVAIDAPRK
jgi:hypothetical protein